jgi:predicted RNase H-like nuclease (RuvC/YqgF family)
VWKQLFEFMRQVFTLTETASRQQSALNELQKEVRDLSRTIDEDIRRLQSAVERLAAELHHQQEHEESERRILKLELENRLLRMERGLPPAQTEAQEEMPEKDKD